MTDTLRKSNGQANGWEFPKIYGSTLHYLALTSSPKLTPLASFPWFASKDYWHIALEIVTLHMETYVLHMNDRGQALD